MRRLVLISAFALGLSCTSNASQRRYTREYSYTPRIPVYDLERATWLLRQDAEYTDPYRGRYDKRVRKETRKLHERARKFRQTVERRHWEDRRVHKSLDRLSQQYYRTERALRRSYGSRRLYRSFSRVRYLMNRIHARYGGSGYRRYERYRY
jgi:hypothetical protein